MSDHEQTHHELRARAEKALKANAEKLHAKIIANQPLTLFDALESIGATMDEMWHGEWTGPILFQDYKNVSRMILVEQSDHDLFTAWLQRHTNVVATAIQDHGREALVRMCARPIDPKDHL